MGDGGYLGRSRSLRAGNGARDCILKNGFAQLLVAVSRADHGLALALSLAAYTFTAALCSWLGSSVVGIAQHPNSPFPAELMRPASSGFELSQVASRQSVAPPRHRLPPRRTRSEVVKSRRQVLTLVAESALAAPTLSGSNLRLLGPLTRVHAHCGRGWL